MRQRESPSHAGSNHGCACGYGLVRGAGRLGALQNLALAFLVTAQNHGVLWRVQIKPDDVPVFFLKLQIVGQLEAAYTVRCNAVRRPKPLNRGFAQPGVSGHLPHTPGSAMSGTRGRHGQRFADGLRRDARLAPPARGITKADKPLPTPTSPPFTHRRRACVKFFGNRLSALAGSQTQDNASSKGFPLQLVAALLLWFSWRFCSSVKITGVGAGIWSTK